MPRIKRYFPVNHDINNDHEIWEMTDTIGERALRIWLELLSIGDRSAGVLPEPSGSFIRVLSARGRCSASTSRRVWEWAVNHSWIVCDPAPRLRNYSEYHIRRGAIKQQDGSHDDSPLPSSHPSEPSYHHKNEEPAAPEPAKPVDSQPQKRELDPRIKAAADPIYRSDPKKFQSLIRWIKQAEKARFEIPAVVLALERFERHADAVRDWWPYLDKLIYKAAADLNRDRHEAEHNRIKRQEKEPLQNLYGIIADVTHAKSIS